MSLVSLETHHVTFPSGERVDAYVKELSAFALRKLEEMTYLQEQYAMERYMVMYNKFYAAASINRKPLSAQRFASEKYVRAFREEYAENEDGEDGGGRLMNMRTAESILHFLFVYYFSFHEAEEAQGKRIKIMPFAAWFGRLRKKLGAEMLKEMQQREKAYNSLAGNMLEDHVNRLREGATKWKEYWRAHTNGDLRTQFNDAARVVTVANFDSKDWWEVFKIRQNRVQTTGAIRVKREVLRNFRRWSRFIHPDVVGNSQLGEPFSHRLMVRMASMANKKQDMEDWFESLVISV